MKDSKVTFRLIDFIILNIAIVAVIAVIVFNNVNNLHKEASNNGTISKEIIQEDLKKEIENRYYYNQLNDYGKKMYNTFLSNIDKFKAGDEYISIDLNTDKTNFYEMTPEDIKVKAPREKIKKLNPQLKFPLGI